MQHLAIGGLEEAKAGDQAPADEPHQVCCQDLEPCHSATIWGRPRILGRRGWEQSEFPTRLERHWCIGLFECFVFGFLERLRLEPPGKRRRVSSHLVTLFLIGGL